MYLTTYQELSQRTMPISDDPAIQQMNIFNYTLGLTGEAGEVADLIKKKNFHGHDVSIDEIKKELGDVLHYIAGLCTMHDLTLEEVATANIAKLIERFPFGFSAEDSIKRVDVNVD